MRNDYVKWAKGMDVLDPSGVSVTVTRYSSLVNSVFVRYPDGSEREFAAEAVTVPEADQSPVMRDHVPGAGVFVEITDVYADALQIPARFLRKGDQVFDAFGGRYALTHVRPLTGGRVSTRRIDHAHHEHWDAGDPVTAVLATDVDPLHGRIPGDVLAHLSDNEEWTVLRVTTTKTDVVYLVQGYRNDDIREMSNWVFHRP